MVARAPEPDSHPVPDPGRVPEATRRVEAIARLVEGGEDATLTARLRGWVAAGWSERSRRRPFLAGAAVTGALVVGAGAAWVVAASARTAPAPTSPPTVAGRSATALSSPTRAAADPTAGGEVPDARDTRRVGGATTPPAVRPALYAAAAGAVAQPGLYRLAGDARVADLVRAAGGFAADADADRVNLAAPLEDGVRVYVPRRGELGAPPAVSGPDHRATGELGGGGGGDAPTTERAPDPVNLNTATAGELDTLPGIGPATAAAIVAFRSEHGPFSSVADLQAVRGIGPAKLEQLRGLVTV